MAVFLDPDESVPGFASIWGLHDPLRHWNSKDPLLLPLTLRWSPGGRTQIDVDCFRWKNFKSRQKWEEGGSGRKTLNKKFGGLVLTPLSTEQVS